MTMALTVTSRAASLLLRLLRLDWRLGRAAAVARSTHRASGLVVRRLHGPVRPGPAAARLPGLQGGLLDLPRLERAFASAISSQPGGPEFPEDGVKKLAATWPNQITDGPNDEGKMFKRPAKSVGSDPSGPTTTTSRLVPPRTARCRRICRSSPRRAASSREGDLVVLHPFLMLRRHRHRLSGRRRRLRLRAADRAITAIRRDGSCDRS